MQKNQIEVKRVFLLVIMYLPLAGLAMNATIDATVSGYVTDKSGPITGVTIFVEGTSIGTSTNADGFYKLKLPSGDITLVASAIGYKANYLKLYLEKGEKKKLDIFLDEDVLGLDQVVVTGTRTFKKQTESAIIVNVIDNSLLEAVQACSLSEGLRFQTGLRVETDCQTCNYTQLRMNGLAGGYSQILINGRPIFSPLTGLYGLEQIPANMIDRVEVVRGGGSALYGSSAIGGTVNVITNIPKKDDYSTSFTNQIINKEASEQILSANATLVNEHRNAGISIFVNKRNRELYDHNKDNYSELPELENNSFGLNMFFLPSEQEKIELSMSSLHEFRYGGEMVKKAAHLTEQSEERTHNVLMGSLDYQINFNNENSSFITYFSGQKTDRDHYTGIFPDSPMDIAIHLENPPYGDSEVSTFQGGIQFNHRLNKFITGANVITVGSEYTEDEVYDEIETYNYLIDQRTTNFGLFFQSDWLLLPKLNLLTGIRADKHNFLSHPVFSPRASVLYTFKERAQLRFTYGTGFRAPQAFDADLHIAFAGGGISRIQLSDDLKEEKSNSISASFNYDKAAEKYIAGFTLESFYTKLKDAFYQHPLGEDEFGELFEKRNGDGATVKGITLELRANYNKKVQMEAGMTFQSSEFDEVIAYSDVLAPKKEFLRTPDVYGYATLSITPNKRWNSSVNLLYTGQMEVLHLAGAPEQLTDAFIISDPFTELNFKTSYSFVLPKLQSSLEVFGGIKNVFNEYQEDFDTGKNRDSNYIYGPAMPRTLFFGVKLSAL